MKNKTIIYELRPIFNNNFIGAPIESAKSDIWTEENLKAENPIIKEFAVFKSTRIR